MEVTETLVYRVVLGYPVCGLCEQQLVSRYSPKNTRNSDRKDIANR